MLFILNAAFLRVYKFKLQLKMYSPLEFRSNTIQFNDFHLIRLLNILDIFRIFFFGIFINWLVLLITQIITD